MRGGVDRAGGGPGELASDARRSLEVIVSDAAASPFFEGLLLKFGIPGRAIVP